MALPSYRLKVERAKRHIRELSEEIAAFYARDPYVVLVHDDLKRGERLWQLRVAEAVPCEWSAIVGDAIHNVRSSLDLMLVAIVRRCDPNRASYNHVHFIVGETKEKFEARLSENIKGASAEARRLIEDLKPYKGGDEAFWRLHQLDILDKHKAIIPVGAAHAGVHIGAHVARLFRDNQPGVPAEVLRGVSAQLVAVPSNRQFPLQDGAVLFAAPLNEQAPTENELNFSIEIAFGEGQILDGEPIVPALTQMCEFVEGVFDIFERANLAP